MRVTPTRLPAVLLIEPVVHGDARGYFFESWHRDRYADAGLPREFVQDNLSRSQRGILRGLHLQHPFAQGKLVQALEGEVFDVAVDVRVGSPSFGQWASALLTADNKHQLYIPPGFAHGFCVVSETAVFAYKCTELYHPETELGISWNDPAIGIVWPIAQPKLSAKDEKAPRLADVPRERLPQFRDA